MYYFKFLALILGVLMIAAGVVALVMRERWTQLMSEKLMPEKQPFWHWLISGVTAVFVVITWYMELTTRVSLSWIITLIMTLAIPKMYFSLFRYQWTRKMQKPLMDRPKLYSMVLGSLAFCMGLFILAVGMFSLQI